MSHLRERIDRVEQRIQDAVRRAGRARGEVTLVAVTKKFSADVMREAYELGLRVFGENYVQEAVEKQAALADLPGLEWHLIGPLQGNKARVAAAAFDWVETVDRLKIAERLAAARPAARGSLNVLVQVNASGEATKHGVAPDEAVALARDVSRLPGLTLRGIMGIPEPTADGALQRAQFALLRRCFDDCRAAGLAVDTLSMGMSADLEAAIGEGATQVRVGTAIFGARARAPA